MTAEQKHIDPALDRAMATSPEPIAPADLAGRITAQATAKPQRKAIGLLRSRRTRPVRTRARRGRSVILGSVGVGFLAVSAAAAVLVNEGTLDLRKVAEPVVALFSPPPESPPVETATPVVERTHQEATVVLDAPQEAVAALAEAEVQPVRSQRRLTRAQRVRTMRRRAQRRRARRAAAGLPTRRPVVVRRQAVRAARRGAAITGNPRPAARLREAARNGQLTPVQRERVQAWRERRQQRIEAGNVPAVRPNRRQVIEARRARLRELQRNRQTVAPTPPSSARPTAPETVDPPASPFRPLPIEGAPDRAPDAAENPPGADRASGPPPEIMAPAANQPDATPDQLRAATPAERARRARQRQRRVNQRRANQRPRPRRPRIPRRRR